MILEVNLDDAVVQLLAEIEKASAGDLAEYHNELFPQTPVTVEEAATDRASVLEPVQEAFRRGLEIDEIISLWRIVFPQHRAITYDEETKAIQYNEGKWPYYSVDELH